MRSWRAPRRCWAGSTRRRAGRRRRSRCPARTRMSARPPPPSRSASQRRGRPARTISGPCTARRSPAPAAAGTPTAGAARRGRPGTRPCRWGSRGPSAAQRRFRRPRGGPAAYFRRGWRGEDGGAPRMVGFERGGAEWRREAAAAISSAAREREGGEASADSFTKKSVLFLRFSNWSLSSRFREI